MMTKPTRLFPDQDREEEFGQSIRDGRQRRRWVLERLSKPKGGRPPVPARAALTGILFVLRTGIPWEMLPAEIGCGSGVTCW